MAPPKPTSIPSARPTGTPGRTSLSSGTRGLKFMQRGAAAKPSSSSSSTPGAASSTAAFTPPAPTEAAATLSSAATGDGPPKKVKGWLGVPQAEAESQWVLPSAPGAGANELEAWGDVGMDGADDGKLEVEDSYLPFLLGAGKAAGSGGGGKGGRWSYGGLNREVEKLSAPPAPAPAPSSSKPPGASTSADAPSQPEASTSKSAAAEGGFLRPAAFADGSSDDEDGPSAKGKSKASSSSASSARAPAPAAAKTKYPQGARAGRQQAVPSSSSYNSLTGGQGQGGGQQRGKKRPSSDAFDAPRSGGGLLSGLELGDSAAAPTTGAGLTFGAGGGGGGGPKKGRYQYDNGARQEGGLDGVGRGSTKGAGGKGSNRRK